MKKILIIDDAQDCRQVIKTMLKKYDLDIIEANDGLEGWRTIIKEKPDLVLLDIHMPLKDGFEILKDIEEEWLDVPVIIISGDTSPNTMNACLLNGASAFINKPVMKNDFNNILKFIRA
ncbi:response regulator [Labilibacter sediminis]|nr:response regulator [Labilibacter sediminis]